MYSTIFRFLWRLRRVRYVLSNTWMTSRTLLREGRGKGRRRRGEDVSLLMARFHKYNVLRHKMVHFVNTLQYYVIYEGNVSLRTGSRWVLHPLSPLFSPPDVILVKHLRTYPIIPTPHCNSAFPQLRK